MTERVQVVVDLLAGGDGMLQLSPPVTDYQQKLDAAGAGNSYLQPADLCAEPEPKGEVRKHYHGGVRPDHMLFESIATKKTMDLSPKICCPNCGQPVRGLAGAVEEFQPPKNCAMDLLPNFLYRLDGCGCAVNNDWAAAYSKEVARRLAGHEPRVVIDMTEAERSARAAQLNSRIVDLFTERDRAKTVNEVALAEYRLVVVTSRLMRLYPGSHNKRAAYQLRDTQVKQWAKNNKLPSGNETTGQSSSEAYSDKYPMPKLGKGWSKPANLHFNVEWNDAFPDKTIDANDALGLAFYRAAITDKIVASIGIAPEVFGGHQPPISSVQTKPVGAPANTVSQLSFEDAVKNKPGTIVVRQNVLTQAWMVLVDDKLYKTFDTQVEAEEAAHAVTVEANKRRMEYQQLSANVAAIKQQAAKHTHVPIFGRTDKTTTARQAYGESQGMFANAHSASAPKNLFKTVFGVDLDVPVSTDDLKEVFGIAQTMLTMSLTEQDPHLQTLAKHDATRYALVKSAMAQLRNGLHSVDGQVPAAKLQPALAAANLRASGLADVRTYEVSEPSAYDPFGRAAAVTKEQAAAKAKQDREATVSFHKQFQRPKRMVRPKKKKLG